MATTNITYKRGFNQIKTKSCVFEETVKYNVNIISDNYLDIKIVAIDNNNKVVSSNTDIIIQSWYNEISVRKEYSINIMNSDCDIYLCFHAHCNGNLTIEDSNYTNSTNDVLVSLT